MLHENRKYRHVTFNIHGDPETIPQKKPPTNVVHIVSNLSPSMIKQIQNQYQRDYPHCLNQRKYFMRLHWTTLPTKLCWFRIKIKLNTSRKGNCPKTKYINNNNIKKKHYLEWSPYNKTLKANIDKCFFLYSKQILFTRV